MLLQVLMNDNLELGCTFIEKAATDKAIREIDERLLPAYQVGRRCSTRPTHPCRVHAVEVLPA